MTALISCIFGHRFNRMYPAPRRYPAHFFSNNPALERQARRKGWRFHYVDVPLSDDYIVSSLQSKAVKFLQLRHLTPYERLIYADHKLLIRDAHIDRLLALQERPVLLRDNHKLKRSVWDEVEDSKEARYQPSMSQTVAYILSKAEQGYSESLRVGATGLIVYTMSPRVFELADTVYRDLCTVGTPQCQIIWSMASQPYRELIQQIPWNAVPIQWKRPSRTRLALHYLAHPFDALRTIQAGLTGDTHETVGITASSTTRRERSGTATGIHLHSLQRVLPRRDTASGSTE